MERDVSTDRAGAEEMIGKSGQLGVPVIDIDGQIMVGSDVGRLESLLAQKRPQRPSFGVAVADATSIARQGGLPPVFGAYVGRVAPSSPAESADLRPGDIIIEVDTQHIHSAEGLEKAVASLSPGSRVSVTYLRGAEERRTEVLLLAPSAPAPG